MNITEENATQPCKQLDLEVKEIKVMMPLAAVELQQEGRQGGGLWGRTVLRWSDR